MTDDGTWVEMSVAVLVMGEILGQGWDYGYYLSQKVLISNEVDYLL
jgi:hypothetical protein